MLLYHTPLTSRVPIRLAHRTQQQETRMSELGNMNIGELCDAYRSILGELDECRAQEKQLNSRKSELQSEVLRRCDAESIDKLAGDGITLTVREKPFVKIEGDWDQIVKALAESGHSYLIQRRVSAGKLQEEMDSGLRLPDGVSIETVREVGHRRS